ncbi:hypothetical protein J2W88_001103 [Acidovorax delafieldii]|uniref:Uncharacterized protein n=1 Tax=Acidovorax delafieldii TaxID=47920 RepID=A0AAJ2BTI1_ACIDE|nr:hypothetical protein [Acidovorax delafieldii]MDR6836282.1 hypothetical protein [Acidovorax delafieldii]MDR7364747.1 hypothetical protein [Acidovorax delafieldii]
MVNVVTLARGAMLTAEPHAGQSALCAECNTDPIHSTPHGPLPIQPKPR